ncbi:MAG: HNH endonuclease [Lentisphaerae bacterium]|nr:MAG: HNH endonuclease [Lentisphaerota bacterium]
MLKNTGILDQHVLALNRYWYPINVTTVFNAICSVYDGRAYFVDEQNFTLFLFVVWVENWSDAIRFARIQEEKVVRCQSFGIRAPEVILYHQYSGTGGLNECKPGKVRISRRNIFLRDKNRCQYCGRKFSSQDLTLDHIIPRSRGGRMTWENIVLCCIECNRRKGARTPAEAGRTNGQFGTISLLSRGFARSI